MTTKLLPKIIAHRGASGLAPENTLSAMRKAKSVGATWVEFDVMLTRDEIPVIIHDQKLTRTTNGQGLVNQLDYKELEKLDAGSWFSQAYSGERVPSLAACLDELLTLGLNANIEIKPCPSQAELTTQKTYEILAAHRYTQQHTPLISSFDYRVLKNPTDYPLGFLIHRWVDDWLAQAKFIKATTVHCSEKVLNPARITEIKSAGFDLAAYTVNNPARANALFQWGIDSIFTDRPDLFL